MSKQVLYISVFIFVLISSTFADRRSYVWTYQYMTLPEGSTELEFYQTTKLSLFDTWEYRIEVEHGVTDHFDFSVYQIFNQKEGDAFRWDAVQFRARYRFGEVGQYLLDPLIYIEYNRKLDLTEPNKIESKLILAKNINKTNISFNPVYEFFFAPGTEHELGLDIGLSYEFNPKFILGIESTSRFEVEDNNTKTGSYLGPTMSFASGNWWYTIGTGFGVTEESDDARVRFLMGIQL